MFVVAAENAYLISFVVFGKPNFAAFFAVSDSDLLAFVVAAAVEEELWVVVSTLFAVVVAVVLAVAAELAVAESVAVEMVEMVELIVARFLISECSLENCKKRCQ